MTSRTDLRTQLRKRRNALQQETRQQYDKKIYNHLVNSALLKRRQHIAVYLSCDGEVNHQDLIERLWTLERQVYLPVLNGSSISFYNYRPDTPLCTNRFNINEPETEQSFPINNHLLDLVIMPLTGFSQQGDRLGMGGGFYDRSFAFMKQRKHLRKPYLLGSAYECQQSNEITADKHDVPLAGVVTENGLRRFHW